MADPLIRIFVSSPSDLDHERALTRSIIEALAQEYLPYFKVQAVLWEQEALTAAQSFQAGLVRPSDCEIVLVMLWARLGTPLANDPYGGMTGTEWEFVDAVEASARTGSPEVLVYRKTAPCLVDVNNAEAAREALADRNRLESFFRNHFFNADGSFRRAFRQFSNDHSFRDLVETQLRKLLNRRISAERRQTSHLQDWQGSPFRVDRPFEFTDHPVFVGRETETRELISRLEANTDRGRGLLLVTGPSGVGKSSLIRAGLLPRLARPFLFPGIALCRWCLVDLEAGDPLQALASAISVPTILGDALQHFGLDAAALADLLATSPEVAAAELAAALGQVTVKFADQAGSNGGRAQLAIVIDPLDPLFADPVGNLDATRAFLAALRCLAARDGIWVIATLRSDYLPLLATLPELATALDEISWFALDPPATARIRQVIEIPARIAALDFEEPGGGAGRGLVDTLESEVSTLTHWPPLLQEVLDALYRRARGREAETRARDLSLLTLADLRGLGGVSGTLIARAETLWTELEPAQQAALPTLCRALTTLEGSGATRPGLRAGDLRTLARRPAVAQLLEGLIAARLVVADAEEEEVAEVAAAPSASPTIWDDLRRIVRQIREERRIRHGGVGRLLRLGTDPISDGTRVTASPTASEATTAPEPVPREVAHRWAHFRPIASFVHPLLLERWAPVRDWLAEPAQRRDLVLRYQLSRQARLWRRTDRNREYLLGEAGYAAAQVFATAYADELEPLERDYLEQSRLHLGLQRRRNRVAQVLGWTLLSLLVIATSTAWWAWEASNQARLGFYHSQLRNAENAIDRGNTAEAVRLALAAGPYLPAEATDSLSRAFIRNRLISMVTGPAGGGAAALAAAFSDDGEQLAMPAPGGGAERWILQGQRYHFAGGLAGPELPIHSLRFPGVGEMAIPLGIGEEGVWRLPAAAGDAPTWGCGGRPRTPIALAPSGRYLALIHGDRRSPALCVLDLRTPGAILWDRQIHERGLRGLTFSPDGQRLVTASFDGTAKVVATHTGEVIAVLPPDGSLGRPAYHAVFDPSGERVAVAFADDRIRVYDLAGGALRELAELGVITRDGRKIRIHRASIRKIAFGPGGQNLVAVDDDGQVVRWDLATGEAQIFGHHDLAVDQVRIAAGPEAGEEEPLVLTASQDDTIRLWGLWTGQSLAVMSHEGDVSEARFSHDQGRILSYSSEDGSARLWSVRPTATFVLQFPQPDQVAHLALTMAPPAVEGAGPTDSTMPSGATSPTGSQPATSGAMLLATGSHSGQIEVWRLERGAEGLVPALRWRLGGGGRGHQDRVRRVGFSPSGGLLASAGFDGTARVWDLAKGESVCTLALTPDRQPCTQNGSPDCPALYQALFAPQGDWLLTASNDSWYPVRLWDLRTCTPLGEDLPLEGGAGGVRAAAMARDEEGGVWVASGAENGTVNLFRVAATGQWSPACTGAWHKQIVQDLAFSPDARSLATAGEDGRVALVELAGGACGEPRYLEPQAGPVTSVRFAPDGRTLVSASGEGEAQVWTRDGTLLARLSGHKARILSLDVSPDGRWLLTASRDGTVRLWPRPTQFQTEPLSPWLTLSAGLGGASHASFSPDGLSIGVAYRNDAALIWQLWNEGTAMDPALVLDWGAERARLTLIQAARRFMDENLQAVRPVAAP